MELSRDNQEALLELRVLMGTPGTLRIITNMPSRAARFGFRGPSAFVQHSVTSIEGPRPDGSFLAHSAEGDWCMGEPRALLNQLLKWRGGPSPKGHVFTAKTATVQARR